MQNTSNVKNEGNTIPPKFIKIKIMSNNRSELDKVIKKKFRKRFINCLKNSKRTNYFTNPQEHKHMVK